MLPQKFTWCFSVQFSHSVVSNSLRLHGLQHARAPCPLPTPGVHSNSCPWSQWCHPAISSSVVPFSSCLQSFSWCFSEATKENTSLKWERKPRKWKRVKIWLKAQHSENKDHGIWSHHFMGNKWGNSGNSVRLYFWGAPKSLQMVIAAMKLKDTYSLEEKLSPT